MRAIAEACAEFRSGIRPCGRVARRDTGGTHLRMTRRAPLRRVRASQGVVVRRSGSVVGCGAGVTGQEFSSNINDELTLFGCSSGL